MATFKVNFVLGNSFEGSITLVGAKVPKATMRKWYGSSDDKEIYRCHKNEYGIVYLLTNPVMPGLVKIGMTAQEDIEKRMRELYTTGVPVPFECQFACKVKKGDCGKIEKALHTAFAPQRVNANREFFRIQVEQAKAITAVAKSLPAGEA